VLCPAFAAGREVLPLPRARFRRGGDLTDWPSHALCARVYGVPQGRG